MPSAEGPVDRAGLRTGVLLASSGISKRYGGVQALQDAELSAPAGEVHALLGENGAGKSTFVKMLTGAVAPDAGELVVGGACHRRLTPAAARELGVAAVFQELSLVPDLTGAENMWLPFEPRNVWRRRARGTMLRRARESFEELGLPPVPLDVPTMHLSVGERQLIEIAKALAARPRILILDEATSALGPAETDLMMGIVKRLAAAGTLCIYISHRLREVRAVADRVTVFRNGRTVATMKPETVTDDELIGHIIGRRLDALYPERAQPKLGEVVLGVRGLGAGDRLRDVDFDLREGEILGVGGLQGQGQLELFLRLFGVAGGPGEVAVRGRSVHLRSPRRALDAGLGIALIPEDRQAEGLLLEKSVRENLALTRLGELTRWGLVRRGLESKLARDLIGRFNIATAGAEQAAGTLSGGNQQKVVIGKFVKSSIQVLLCYDPTRGVDVGAKHEIFEWMVAEAAQGRAVLFFSTESDELIHLCDRVLVLAGGRISGALEREALSEQTLMRAALALGTTDAPERE